MSPAPSSRHDPLVWIGIAEGAELLRSRQLSPLEWATALIERIEGVGRPLDAFLYRAPEQVFAAARESGEQLVKGLDRGPLHGVPYAVKDIISTLDRPTTAHSRLLKGHQPARDAEIIRRLRAAGAVMLGKTATHEFAHGGPSTDLPWPPARNPWNLEHVPGGSSSGSAAALAGGLAPAALGTDTGGSIRIPAGLCGVTGLKPTYGRVSRQGIFPLAPALDTAGPMARSARDCALLLQAIAGFDPNDPGCARQTVPDFSAGLNGDLRGMRIGVIRHFWETDTTVHPEAAAAMEEALDVLSTRGAILRNIRLAPLIDYGDVRALVQEAEAFAIYHEALIHSITEFGEDFLARILPACLVPGFVQIQAARKRRLLIEQMHSAFETVDALITIGTGPAARFDAPNTHGALHSLWSDRPNIPAPFSVTGFPAMSVCNGFSSAGLPTSMQIVGRPWDEARVLKVGEAFQRDTNWHRRRPPDPAPMPPVQLAPSTSAESLDHATRTWADAAMACARLSLNPSHRELVYAAASRVRRAIERMGVVSDRSVESASVFRL